MRTIKELINEEKIFGTDLISPNGVIGMGIGYLMEQAGIPDFTNDGYDPNKKKCLGDYVQELQSALKTVNDYFEIVAQQDQAKAQQAANMFMPVLQSNLNGYPGHFSDAFRFCTIEENPSKKVELQLIEIKMYSRVSDASDRSIVGRVENIDRNSVPEDLRPIYERACKYFLSK